MGKLTISMAIFNSFLYVYQSVIHWCSKHFMSKECLAFQCGLYPKNYWLEWFGNQIWNTRLDSNRIAMHEWPWLDLVTWQWPILYTLQEKSHVSVVGVVWIWIYVYIYICIPVTDSGTYLSKVYWLLCSKATVHWNKSPSRYVGPKKRGLPHIVEQLETVVYPCWLVQPQFSHMETPFLDVESSTNNHVRLVKIGLGRELLNPIYHHRNLLLFWG